MIPFKNILVVVDSSVERHAELERARKLVDQTDAKLHLVDVVKDLSLTLRLLSKDHTQLQQSLVAEKQESLNALVAHCKSHGIDATGEVLEGQSSLVTVKAAQKFGADLIIRPSKGVRSLELGPLGSSAQKLIRGLPCPVWLTQADHEPNYKTILAAVDATPHDTAHAALNHRILQTGLELAKQERCKLMIVYVWNLHGSEMLKNRLAVEEYEQLIEHNRKQHLASFEKLLAAFELHATGPNTRMIEGEPSTAIPQLCEAEQADLLICGTVARRGITGLLVGNTAERIINRCNCSVLALTPSDRQAQLV
jgi:universal stress protein E